MILARPICIIIITRFLCLLLLSVCCNTEREREKRFLIAIRSFYQAQSQLTNQIKGNYRKEKIEREKEKEDASLRNPAIGLLFYI
jgi:hypothetical protein